MQNDEFVSGCGDKLPNKYCMSGKLSRLYMYTFTYIHTFIHTYIHTYIHTPFFENISFLRLQPFFSLSTPVNSIFFQ